MHLLAYYWSIIPQSLGLVLRTPHRSLLLHMLVMFQKTRLGRTVARKLHLVLFVMSYSDYDVLVAMVACARIAFRSIPRLRFLTAHLVYRHYSVIYSLHCRLQPDGKS